MIDSALEWVLAVSALGVALALLGMALALMNMAATYSTKNRPETHNEVEIAEQGQGRRVDPDS